MRKDGLDINNGKSWIERLNANNISFCCSLRNKEEKAPSQEEAYTMSASGLEKTMAREK
jgi:hypothetical protein